LHKTVREGCEVAEVPVESVDRTQCVSKLGSEYIKNTLMYIFKARFQEIIKHRVFKFVVVGGFGAFIQLTTLQIWRIFLPFQIAFFLSVECAIVSNFFWNNLWTFSDRKLHPSRWPKKFLQFNIASSGSLIIQQIVALVGEFGIGLFALFTLPIIKFTVDTGTVYAMVGIFMGLFWNFFAYNKFIWKKKK